ncbi:hypothetical protein RCL1_004119 [Eukaryota sp. TZLM3-RCL]
MIIRSSEFNLLHIIGVTIPSFFSIAAGFIAVKSKVLPPVSISHLNTFVFKFSMPCLLFLKVSQSEFSSEIATFLKAVVVFKLIGLMGALILSFLLKLFKHNTPFGVNFFAFFSCANWTNVVILGIPIAADFFGEDSLKYVLICGSIDYFTQIPLAAIVLDSNSKGLLHIPKVLFTNPPVAAIVAGLSCSLLGIKLGFIVSNSLDYLSNSVKGGAHFAAGMYFALILSQDRLALPSADVKSPLLCVEEGINKSEKDKSYGSCSSNSLLSSVVGIEVSNQEELDPRGWKYLSLLFLIRIVYVPLLVHFIGLYFELIPKERYILEFIACLPLSLSAFVVARSYDKCCGAINRVVVYGTFLMSPLFVGYHYYFDWKF